MGPPAVAPESIATVDDAITKSILLCEATKKPYRIITQELAFYRRMGVPVPQLSPEERHRRRVQMRNPRRLWNRPCAKCAKDTQTTYAPERPEIVYCEQCYLDTVY
jgi:hypothetical protein